MTDDDREKVTPKPIRGILSVPPLVFVRICDSCLTGEHACGGDCDCDNLFCLKRRTEQAKDKE